jgi:hypothetical protein
MVGLLSLSLSSIPEQTSQRPRHGRPKQGPAPCMHGLGQFLGACWLSTGVGSGRERTGRLVQQGKASVHSSTMRASASFVSYFISSGREAQSHRATCMPLRPRSSAACVPSRGTCEPHLPFVARVASAPPPHKSEENNTLYRLSLNCYHRAGIAQLGERQTEDLKVACSIHAHRIPSFFSQSDSALI